MIVVEGLDNTGKTTLVEALRGDFPELTHYPSIGNKHDLTVIRTQAIAWDNDDKLNPFVITDRSRFISEYIYNPVLQGRDLAFSPRVWWQLMSSYCSRPQVLIYCRRPYAKVAASFDEREQLGGVAENLEKLHHTYDRVMGFFEFYFDLIAPESVFMRYDYEMDDYNIVKVKVNDYIKRMENR